MTEIYTVPTLDIAPGKRILKGVIKERLEAILRNFKGFEDVLVFSEHTDSKISNKAIYISTKSRNKESTGIDNYGGLEKGLSMLTRMASVDVPGTSIEWASVDSRVYDGAVQKGSYFIVLDDGTYSYLRVTDEEDNLADHYDGISTTFTLSEEPADPFTVRLYVRDLALVRGVDFSVEGSEVTLIRAIPPCLPIRATYKVERETSEPIPFKKGKQSEMLPGVVLFFSENSYIGDEMVLFLYEEDRPTYHVYSSRADISVNLLFSLGDKKEEDRLTDYIYTRVDLEMRTFFQDCGWVMKDLSYSEDDREEWETGAYYSVANSTLSMTINMEWSRFIPLIKEFAGFLVSAKGCICTR